MNPEPTPTTPQPITAPQPPAEPTVRKRRWVPVVAIALGVVVIAAAVFIVIRLNSSSTDGLAQGQSITATVPRPEGSAAEVKATVTKSGYDKGYLIIRVTIDGIKGQAPVNPLDWTLRDDNGSVYQAAMMVNLRNGLRSSDIAGGQSVTGEIAFTVTAGQRFIAVWKPMFQEAGSWVLTP